MMPTDCSVFLVFCLVVSPDTPDCSVHALRVSRLLPLVVSPDTPDCSVLRTLAILHLYSHIAVLSHRFYAHIGGRGIKTSKHSRACTSCFSSFAPGVNPLHYGNLSSCRIGCADELRLHRGLTASILYIKKCIYKLVCIEFLQILDRFSHADIFYRDLQL